LTYTEAANLYEELEARAATRRRRSSWASPRSRLPKRRPAYALTACSLAAAGAIIAGALLSGGARPSPTSGGTGAFGRSGSIQGFQPVPIGSDPLPGGRSVSLNQASRLLGVTVPTPDAPLANPNNLSVVWGIRGEVMLDYAAAQIRIAVKPANRILRNDAAGAFEKTADELHMSPGALTINGAPALVDGGSAGSPGFAEIVRDGLSISVMGHRSATELIGIARSLSTTETQ